MKHIKKYVLYHANCRDGFAAAYAIWKIFDNSAIYIPVQYGRPIPAIEEDSIVYIVDFAYSRQEIINLKYRMLSVQVIDHHKTHAEELAGMDCVIMDLNKSGCILTWEYFHADTPPPEWMLDIQDRDLWKFKRSTSEAVTEAINSYAYTFEGWDHFENIYEILKTQGYHFIRNRNIQIQNWIKNPIISEIAGYKVPSINTGIWISETANQLCKKYPDVEFAACYFDIPGIRIWSLRSIGDFDVSEIAKKFGGGGHKNAAGYQEKI